MIDEHDMEHWWNATDKEQSKFSGENLSQCHFVPYGKAEG
jgi:hypothetical protein